MGQALYRKHRPKKLAEVVGQEHITDTLSQALTQGRISHAYLFTGPRGVGKTSIARIMAHEINNLPYEDDSLHIDIIEIDAASNRRIDEIRELRDKVYIAPAAAKYKVYIIDEVHMLTREAFNALLKTLEEPPAHAIFILATTDAHKLPETIVSRTQRFAFKPVEKSKVAAHLADIAKQEKIKTSPEALDLLASHGEGSFRDSISLLDQASSHGRALELADVRHMLGIPPQKALDQLIELLASGDSASVMQNLTSLYDQGYQASALAKQLGQLIRQAMVENRLSLDQATALELLKSLVNVPASHDPEVFLEINLLQAVPPSQPSNTSTPQLVTSVKEPVKKPLKATPKVESSTSIAKLDESIWPDVLAVLKQRHNTLYGVVRMAQPDFSNSGKLILVFAFAFHEKRIKENANRQKIADVIKELTGQTVSIECSLDKNAKPPKPAETQPTQRDNNLSAISNIFGDAELLES